MRCVEAGFSPGPGHADLPHADQVVAVSGEQSLAIARPGKGGALGRLGTGGPGNLGPQVLHLVRCVFKGPSTLAVEHPVRKHLKVDVQEGP